MAVYSHSRLSSFETCPRKYWFGYIEKPKIERVETVEAFLGSRAHEALEELFKVLLNGRTMSRDELIAWYDSKWEREWHEGIRIVKNEFTAEDYRSVGREALGSYYERYHPFDQARTLDLERRTQIDLDGTGRYLLQGYIDRLAQRDDGTYEIHDYKTSAHLPTQAEADADRQLALYQIGVQGMWDDVERVDLIWDYLRFDKEIVSRRTPQQLDAVRGQCVALIEDIESRGTDEANFPTGPSNLCDWCDFREICPATRHHVAVHALPTEEFKADDGVKLVDEWTRVRDERRKLEGQAAEIKGREQELQLRVLNFARQEGLESVTGSSHHVDITEGVRIDYPKPGDENAEAFEKALRQAGLWDSVTATNWQKLKALWSDSNALTPEVRAALKPFISDTRTHKARLKKGGQIQD